MKWFKSGTLIAVTLVILMLLQSITGVSSEVDYIEAYVFPHDSVIEVNIDIAEEDYNDLLENALNETTYMADITYNGIELTSVGIRAKGNSSLSSVANSDSDRYSYKVDFDEYIDEQSLFGLKKINLNNLFSDPTMMAEFLSYEMLSSLDADASRTTYVNLSINGELQGLYLAVEQVNEEFLIDHYGNADGVLYKPDMGAGADLAYSVTGDYSGMFDELGNVDDYKDLDELLLAIQEKDLDDIMNVDSFLKYLAMSTMVVHLDNYQSGMFHNYYLYYNQGVWEWISWDLNMSFNGFPKVNLTDEEAFNLLIDEPVIGSMSDYPLVEAVLSNEVYLEQYHDYLEELMANYFDQGNFQTRVTEIYEMIDEYVKLDPTSFYDYETFKDALFGSDSILDFVSSRNESVQAQLNGETASTNNGNGNERGTGNNEGGKMAGGNDRGMPNENNKGMQGNREKPAGGNMNMPNERPVNDQMDIDKLIKIAGDQISEELLSKLQSGEAPTDEEIRTLMESLTDEQRQLLMPKGNMPTDEITHDATQVEDTMTRDGLLISILFGALILAVSIVISKIRR